MSERPWPEVNRLLDAAAWELDGIRNDRPSNELRRAQVHNVIVWMKQAEELLKPHTHNWYPIYVGDRVDHLLCHGCPRIHNLPETD